MTVINLLAPIFLVIALGAGLQRGGMMTTELVAGVNKLLYWVGLPAAVFYSLVNAGSAGEGFGGLLIALVGATLLTAAVGWMTAPMVGVSSGSRGTFVQGAFRGNIAFIALPLLLTVPGVPLAKAMLTLAPMIILHNVFTVFVLTVSKPNQPGNFLATSAVQLIKNPLVISALGGAIFAKMSWTVPVALNTTFQVLGRMSLPMALLCIGATLMSVPVKGNRMQGGCAAVLKVMLAPALGYGFGSWLGLDDGAMLALLICLASPTASASYTMAQQLGGDGELAATVVVYSAIASAVSLGVVIAVFAI